MPYTPIFVVSFSFLHVSVMPKPSTNLALLTILGIQKGAQKYIITLPCSAETKIAFAGDETVNIGLIVHAIFTQPDKTLGKIVWGVTEYLTGPEIASALSKALEKTAAKVPNSGIPSTQVAFVETTLESYEAIWGPVGTETGIMYKLMNDVPSFSPRWGSGDVSEPIVTPSELGLHHSRTVEQRLGDLDWEAALAYVLG